MAVGSVAIGILRSSRLEGCGMYIVRTASTYTVVVRLLQMSEGYTESWLGPLMTLIGKYLTSFRYPDASGA
eukprot:scaffold417502_cov50-Prasinocladus_malaysianus.AAC.1